MGDFEIRLMGFEFPGGLPNRRANFRFVVDVRFTDEEKLVTEHAVMPSLDTFWECDTNRTGKPNYVRGQDVAAFDMKRIDAWDKLVLCLRAKELHSMQVKVMDVDRKDAWDAVKDFLGGVVRAFLGKLKVQVPSSTLISDSLGSATEDIQSFLLKKLAGGDKLLFRGSCDLKQGVGRHTILGIGTDGSYRIEFEVV